MSGKSTIKTTIRTISWWYWSWRTRPLRKLKDEYGGEEDQPPRGLSFMRHGQPTRLLDTPYINFLWVACSGYDKQDFGYAAHQGLSGTYGAHGFKDDPMYVIQSWITHFDFSASWYMGSYRVDLCSRTLLLLLKVMRVWESGVGLFPTQEVGVAMVLVVVQNGVAGDMVRLVEGTLCLFWSNRMRKLL